VENNKIVGTAYIIPSGNPTDLFKKEWSYIRMVSVNPNYQGQGIAKALTKMCIAFAKQNKEKTIALHTSEFMDAARHIYENMGFKILKEIPALFGKKYWLYTLELN
jgi:ribosomal protein S18 acetylase RimI-like enzyme